MYSKINGMNLRYLLLACLSILASLSLKAQINQQYVSYIETYKELAIEQMERYHIPASITLAQGLLRVQRGRALFHFVVIIILVLSAELGGTVKKLITMMMLVESVFVYTVLFVPVMKIILYF